MDFKVSPLWEALLDRLCLATGEAVAEFSKSFIHRKCLTALQRRNNIRDP